MRVATANDPSSETAEGGATAARGGCGGGAAGVTPVAVLCSAIVSRRSDCVLNDPSPSQHLFGNLRLVQELVDKTPPEEMPEIRNELLRILERARSWEGVVISTWDDVESSQRR